MEEKKITKKKKLTLSISSNKSTSKTHYAQGRGKTSVVIEKRPPRRWGDKKFQSKSHDIGRSKSSDNFVSKKPLPNKSFDIRKIAEEKPLKDLKN